MPYPNIDTATLLNWGASLAWSAVNFIDSEPEQMKNTAIIANYCADVMDYTRTARDYGLYITTGLVGTTLALRTAARGARYVSLPYLERGFTSAADVAYNMSSLTLKAVNTASYVNIFYSNVIAPACNWANPAYCLIKSMMPGIHGDILEVDKQLIEIAVDYARTSVHSLAVTSAVEQAVLVSLGGCNPDPSRLFSSVRDYIPGLRFFSSSENQEMVNKGLEESVALAVKATL